MHGVHGPGIAVMGHPGDLAQLRFIEMRVGENDADRGIAGEFAQNAYFLNPRNRVPWKVSIPFSPLRSMSKSSLLTFSFTAPLFLGLENNEIPHTDGTAAAEMDVPIPVRKGRKILSFRIDLRFLRARGE